ncbi:MAG: methyltransferase domain-containing protein [Candidatus Hatepunaea meridiana]|nr:methyltransferase domain-containing protein [Candidatus Hatepunaea meridiana]
MNQSDNQTINNQLGEITFRRKLVQQQVDGDQLFEDEFDKENIEKILRERMDVTLKRMKELKDKGTVLSPYLEIGAERGQRSLVMETDLNLRGAATDLSFDMLKSCEYYKDVFDKNMPVRVCADLYNLPFKTGSIPFVFCYQTLHHFPDQAPIVEEIHRVLSSGGTFLFDEEPYKKGFHLNLYKTDKVFSEQHIGRSIIRKFLDHLFAEYVCNEEEYDVIENDDISTSVWRRTFARFAQKNIKLHSIGSIYSDLYGFKFTLNYILNYLWGGDISGECIKAGDLTAVEYSITDAMTCPVCLTNGIEPDLKCESDYYICENCGIKYPVEDGVVFLLKPVTLKQLYPEIHDLC